MAREVIWTPEAQEDYRDTVSYLMDQFSDDVAAKYTQKLFNAIETLLKMPFCQSNSMPAGAVGIGSMGAALFGVAGTGLVFSL